MTTLRPTGAFVYTPAANYSGQDSFIYRVSDGIYAAMGSVLVTVNAVNDAPTADPKSAATDEDTAVTRTPTGSDVERSALPFAVVTGPSQFSFREGSPIVIELIFSWSRLINGSATLSST